MVFKRVTHVIFDLDGLVLDSESGYERIMKSMAKVYGKEYTPDVKYKLLGTTETDSASIFIRELDLSVTLEDCLEEYYKRIAVEMCNPPFMPGAKRLIQHLATNNVPIAIATSSGRKMFKVKTQNHQEVIRLFHHIVCGTKNPEIQKGKPAPDIFLNCASKFPDKPNPEQVLVFEDSPNGMQAGIAAGMQTVMVPSAGVSEELRKPATLVLDSLESFKPELFGLPAF
ncbi:pseudouridine-5'-phosphatase [Dendroctonus ponderosae]|uniref:Pseudouridine-5'-monophosphatase n=1 Tax=Dendroctonus ponderosae TaxID=77166 RepID=A0AAR5QJH1_DENPD|nr:pseudouridine-5'-phosphatase [Dendroctonus ponderosae]KAH1013850.1 hypothetical protein HUJ04_002786 [Dendroctonus ponderosae]KAH1024260.1 hypothetical protein HUJ05_003770 [Dendroctonus ponderosae]KAH1024262.1 hypothetical protein HUJ05_003770 [Dendroctonus ponderosae]KAH1024263.1 hypothetical protein HUJ05_003770 [Dendroctonus ponderosae]